jgi:hypothetical protein
MVLAGDSTPLMISSRSTRTPNPLSCPLYSISIPSALLPLDCLSLASLLPSLLPLSCLSIASLLPLYCPSIVSRLPLSSLVPRYCSLYCLSIASLLLL